MDLGLADRTYILTGATGGLGLATAQVLVAEGAKVVISSRSQESVDRTVAELGTSATGIAADNSDPGTPARLISAARDSFGRLDGALISVGGPPAGLLMERSEDEWRSAFESVFLGSIRLATAVGAELGDGGSIAFVLSSSAKMPVANLAISNGLRPGLAMAAKTLADELGPRGIRVNGLLPGRVDTDRVRELDALADDPAASRAANEAAIPLRRYGKPEEFGRAAAFLLSPASGFITGTMLPVDGGLIRGI
ncbi:SDR family oxidoreductase [Aeromicrobium sp.]|uniref:SDR family oxidoreductase n=1 Tax=Aeromicrobium sp. TaxID=1871063 RepID=UPI002FCC8CAE